MTRAWAWLWRVALEAWPRGFREHWGDAMTETFLARLAATPPRARAMMALREIAGAVRAGLAERLHANSWQLRMIHAQDIRYALRLLWRSPGFTLLTILVLAGGLGLSTFTFSFLYTAMIRPLPLGEGERIVRIDPMREGRREPVDAVDLVPLARALTTIEEMGAYGGRDLVVGTDGQRRVVDATVADPILFSIARTPPFLGRFLLPSDAEDGAEPVVVLSHRTWEVAFGSDRGVVNRLVPINGTGTRVVGVMPPGFGFPVASEAWVPLSAATRRVAQAGVESVRLVGRLRGDVTHEEAAAEATPILQRLVAARDTSTQPVRMAIESFPAVQFGEERAIAFTALNLAALLILLLALVNVTNLLLARANERVRETAVRLALGASRPRLVMQGMWETIILCVAGGFFGTAGAAWGLRAITRWTQANMEGNLAFWWVWALDGTAIVAAGAFVTVAIAVLGGIVAWRAAHTNMREVMQDGSARSGSRREGRLSRALVVTQVTTVTVLMFVGVMSGLVARRVVRVDFGYDTARMLQGGVTPPDRSNTPEGRAALFRNLHARLAEHASLDAALLRTVLADIQSPGGTFAQREGNAAQRPSAHVQAALGDLGANGIRLVEGRLPGSADDQSRAPVAVVSQSLARRHWRGRSPVGDQIRLTGVTDTTVWRTIVGVVSDVPLGNPMSRQRSTDAIHIPLLQADVAYSTVFVRYRASEVAGREALLEAYAAVDPLMVPDGVQSMSEVMRKVGLVATSVTRLLAACFGFALLLAVAGAYGLMSRAIGLRTREVGVRRALGATEGSVMRLLLGQGGRQLGVGTVIAAPVLVLAGLGFRYYFPVDGLSTVVVGVAVSLLIIAAVLGATWLPTRRVLRISPRDALWRDS